MNFTDLITAIKTSLKVDEKEKHFILAKIGLLLSKNFEREKVMVALSVRSAFDLYLQARKFEPGSEIVMMGINIPDMVQIMKEHGLVPIPVDYDLETMAPRSFDEIKNAITEKLITEIESVEYLLSQSLTLLRRATLLGASGLGMPS